LLSADAPSSDHSFVARCPVDLSVGKATFAPEGLAIMPAGEGSIRFTAIQKSVVSAGNASVELLVVIGATTQDGTQTMHLAPARFELATRACTSRLDGEKTCPRQPRQAARSGRGPRRYSAESLRADRPPPIVTQLSNFNVVDHLDLTQMSHFYVIDCLLSYHKMLK
jgi:hypothetical protein